MIKLDFPRLARISELFSGAGDEAKEFFSRANEINFFPYLDSLASWSSLDLTNECNWSEIEPLIQVINYSNISKGMVFKVGFKNWEEGEGSFEPVVAPDKEPNWHAIMANSSLASRLVHATIGRAMVSATSKSFFSHTRGETSATQASDAFILESLNHFYAMNDEYDTGDDDYDDGLFDLVDEFEDDEFELGGLDEHEYFESFFQVEHTMAQTDSNTNDDIFEEEEDFDHEDENGDGEEEETGDEVDSGGNPALVDNARTSALKDPPKSHYHKEGFFTHVEVEKYKPFDKLLPTEKKPKDKREKKKLRAEEQYKSQRVVDRAIRMADEYIGHYSIRPAMEEDIKAYEMANGWESPLIWRPGWARRPTSGFYGQNYMNTEFKKICVAQFKRGQANKGDKQSPSQTLEIMKEEFPGVYRLPGIHEIVRTYAGLVSKAKKNQGNDDEDESPRGPLVPAEIKEELQSLLDEHGNITAKPLFELWKTEYGEHKDYTYDKAQVMKVAQYLRQKMLIDKRKQQKRNMSG